MPVGGRAEKVNRSQPLFQMLDKVPVVGADPVSFGHGIGKHRNPKVGQVRIKSFHDL